VLNRKEVTRDTDGSKFSFRMPRGLIGFEGVVDYCLEAKSSEQPFVRMKMATGPGKTLYLVPAMLLFPDYNPSFDKEDIDFLELGGPEDLLLFVVVNFNRGATRTANLKGPILINRRTQIGSQVIPKNANDLSISEPILNH
jgi:flagellar assembly factor FliW